MCLVLNVDKLLNFNHVFKIKNTIYNKLYTKNSQFKKK